MGGNVTDFRLPYPQTAVDRSRDNALEWLEAEREGHPMSWRQEIKNEFPMYGAFSAPPIAGYEALEAEGFVTRGETAVGPDGMERVRFILQRRTLDAAREPVR